MRPVDRLLSRLEGVHPNGEGYKARCPVPAHGKGEGDRNPSLSIGTGELDGTVLLKCFAGCSKQDVLDAVGLSWSDLSPSTNGHSKGRKIAAVYDYVDAEGRLVFQAVRYQPRDFKQRRPKPGSKQRNGVGEDWIWTLKGVERVLYRLPEVIRGVEDERTVYVVEGEKDADRLAKAGFIATTAPEGAGKWRDAFSETLRGAGAVVIPDNDPAGEKHADKVIRSLAGTAARVKLLRLPGEGVKDAFDWFAAGGTAGELERMTREATAWKPPSSSQNASRRTINARELLSRVFPPLRYAVPGIVPEGVTLLAGKPKLGKSWFALGLCIAVASGGYALGTKKVEKGSALYLGLEDNVRRLRSRLEKMLQGEAAPNGLEVATEWERVREGGTEALEDWLKDHSDARLVVIDTLAKVRQPAKGQNVYAEDYAALEPLLPLAAKYGVAIVVVTHTRKLAAADPLDEISGSTGLSGGVDGFLVLKRDRGRADAYLYVDGRDVEEASELALMWDQNLAAWTLAGDAADYRLNEQRTSILEVLREAAPNALVTRDIAEALKADFEPTRQRLYQMHLAGEIKKVGRGKYTVPNNPNDPNDALFDAAGDRFPGDVFGSATVRDAADNPNDSEPYTYGESEGNVRNVRTVRAHDEDFDDLFDETGTG